MSNPPTTKREGSPLPASGTSTPSKRARFDDSASASASGAPASAVEGSSAAADALTGMGAGASSPAPAAADKERETDSPSAGRGKRGGRGGANGGRGGKNDRRGRGGGGGVGRGGGRGAGNGGGWKGGRKDGDEERGEKGAEGDDEDKKDKLPKRKVAVLLGYNGIGYKGSQVNPGMETIEGEVFKAFAKAGAISEDNSSNPQKVSLARAARTDAGVHAALNVLTLKLILSPPSKDPSTSLEEHLNAFLPPAIRVWSVLRVQGSFDPRRLCDQRQYEYTLPTHVLLGPKPGTPMAEALARTRAELASPPPKGALETASDAFWAAQPAESAFGDDVAAKKAWRISAEGIQQAREFLAAYEGSHNFYNFTVGKDFRDRSCQRVMRKLELSEPFVVNDTEYVSVTFIGQSFMLHQIRKMIGLFILALRSGSPASLVPETFGPSRIHVPKAPSLGLLLVAPHYLEYNRRIAEANAKLSSLVAAGRLTPDAEAEQRREALDPALVPGMTAKVDQFKQEQVYKRMWEVEEQELTFSKWLNYLDAFVGADFGYLNPQGVIPPTATFAKGENPERVRMAAAAAAGGVAVEAVESEDEGAAGEDDG
ncbi:tRNA pseudouridine synthase 1 [Rhodotorula kratochvilovae]